ncbi:autotransporter-associated beta strand repeat-containing protein [Aquabacter sp. CN5-332]|uniref:autotransporter-associated beta strand repeat-containing protein n=1 Tax=Aquabacter sp. CN5-332 TaxID=3156608 RepID=UPI0032B4D29B
MSLSQSGAFTNSGSLQGGNGGLGGLGSTGSSGTGQPGQAGAGGAGLVVSALPAGQTAAIVNSGTIAGGFTGGHDGDEAYRASAIIFTGGSNRLTFNNATSGLLGGIELQNNTHLILNYNANVTVPNVISGAGDVFMSGGGTLTLTGTNTYNGGTTIGVGVINFSSASNFGSGNITLLGGGGLQWAVGNTTDISGKLNAIDYPGAVFDIGANNVTFASALSGYGITKRGTGTLTLAASNSYFGSTTVSAGTLRAGAADVIASSSGLILLNFSGVVFDLNGFNQSLASLVGGGTTGGNITLGTAALTVNQADDTTYGGVISGSGRVTKQGAGILTLSGVSTYQGATTISAGTLKLSGAGSIAASSGVAVNGTLDISGTTSGATIKTLSGTSASGVVALGSQPLTVTQSADATFAGGFTGSGALTKVGTGALTLSGDSSTYTGGVSVNAGTLSVQDGGKLTSAGSSIGDPSGATAVAAIVKGTGSSWDMGSGLLALSDVGGGALTIQDGGKVTSGSLVLCQSTCASGVATTLTLSGSAADGRGTLATGQVRQFFGDGLLVFDGGVLQATRTQTGFVQGFDTNEIDIRSGGAFIDSNGFDVEIGSNSAVLSGVGGLTKQGTGTLKLTGPNTYTGATTVSGGILDISNGSALGTTDAGTSVSSGATLALEGDITVGAETLALSGLGVSNLGALRNISGNNTYGGAITLGSTTRINSDAGELTLTGGVTGAFLIVGGNGNTTISVSSAPAAACSRTAPASSPCRASIPIPA